MRRLSVFYYQISVLILASLVLAGCAASKDSAGPALTPSIYYKPTIRQAATRCEASQMQALVSLDGHTLVDLCQKDYDNCLMQGSCYVQQDGPLISYNYHSTKNSIPRFVRVDNSVCPYGYGSRSTCLDPYFSVAADLSLYAVGDVLFIPRLVGAVLPHGEVHDGYVIVRDSGGAIKGEGRFDFFTGFLDHRQKSNTFARLGFSDTKNRFSFRLASPEERAATQKNRNYPGLTEEVKRDWEKALP